MASPIDNPSAFEKVGGVLLKLDGMADQAANKEQRSRILCVMVALKSWRWLTKVGSTFLRAMARNELSLSLRDADELMESCGK